MKKNLDLLKITAYFISSIIIFFCLVIAFEYSLSLGKVHSFVKFEDVDLNLLTSYEAKRIFKNKEKEALNKKIKFLFEDKSWEIKARDLRLRFDINKIYKNAYKLGRSGNLYKDIIERINLWIKGINIEIVGSINQDLTQKFIIEIESEIKSESISSDIFIRNLRVIVTPSQTGLKLDNTQLKFFVEDSLIRNNGGTFNLPVIHIEPLLNEYILKNVKEEAEIIISNPIVLKFPNSNYELNRVKIANMVQFKKIVIEDNNKEKVVVDVSFKDKSMENLIETLSKEIESSPMDAQFIIEDKEVIIEPSVDGIKLNKIEFLFKFEEIAHTKEDRVLDIPILILKPKITTKKAKSMGIKELVSTDTEFFSPYAVDRVHNIQLLTSMLDGVLIPPHNIFSLNETSGRRTKEKGFVEAPTIIRGELVDTVGGGVCNVSTTIFNTVFLGGYKIIERNSHAWYISRYPPGRDAAISWGVQNFKFQNDTDYWILIKGESTKSSCTISFYSTDIGREVEIITTPFSNFKSFGVKYKPDPEVLEGTEIVDSEGIDGRDVYVTRIISKDGEVLSKETIFTRYFPKNKIILLNPKDYHNLVMNGY